MCYYCLVRESGDRGRINLRTVGHQFHRSQSVLRLQINNNTRNARVLFHIPAVVMYTVYLIYLTAVTLRISTHMTC